MITISGISAVVFDLDDTLLWDERLSRRALAETAARAAERAGGDAAALEEAAKQAAGELWREQAPVGRCDALGIVAFEGMWGVFEGEDDYIRHLREMVPRFREEIWRRALPPQAATGDLPRELGEFFARRRRELQEMLPWAAEVLARLRKAGLKIGLLTNGAPSLQRLKIADAGLADFFDAIVVSGEIGIGKPEPEIFHHLAELLGTEPRETLMVGNSLARDVEGARRAGMPSCWLELDGEDEPVGSVAPDHTIRSLRELPGLLGLEK